MLDVLKTILEINLEDCDSSMKSNIQDSGELEFTLLMAPHPQQ